MPDPTSFALDLKRRFDGWLPVGVATSVAASTEPPSQLGNLSADRLHSAIMAAEQGQTRDLFGIYRDVLIADSHMAGEIEKRIIAVAGQSVSIKAKEGPEYSAAQIAANKRAADVIRAAVSRCPGFSGMCADLLWGTVWPLSIVERTYKRSSNGLAYDWHDIRALPDHLLQWVDGQLRVCEVDDKGQLTGKLLPLDTNRYITHRGHLMRTPDYWGGPMRALTWWFFLKTMDREWWVRFLDRFGTPFVVSKFDKNDQQSQSILTTALQMSSRIGGLVVSTDTQVELVQAMVNGSTDAFQQFHDACNREISKRVVGQTLSAEAQPTGMGSGTADLQGQVRGDIADYDKRTLADTIRHQMFAPLLKINGISGEPPDIIWGANSQAASSTAKTLADCKAAGLRPTAAALPALSEVVGFPLEFDNAPAPTIRPLSSPAPTSRPRREPTAALARLLSTQTNNVREAITNAETPDAALAALSATDLSQTHSADIIEAAILAGAWPAADPFQA